MKAGARRRLFYRTYIRNEPTEGGFLKNEAPYLAGFFLAAFLGELFFGSGGVLSIRRSTSSNLALVDIGCRRNGLTIVVR